MSYDLRVVSGDLVLQNGDLRICQDSEKLIQDLLKICLTPAGAIPTQPWYGSYISRSLVGNVLGTSITVQVAQSQLQSAIQNLMSVQQAQIKSGQQVTPDELINSISNIAINRSTIDPRLFSVQVSVISKGFKPISTAFTISTI
jgi:phage baseplate assembly protein W